MKLTTKKFFTVVFFLLIGSSAWAQEGYKPLTLKLDESGEKYIRFIVWHQQWLQASSDNAETAPRSIARRSRFLAYAQISPRFMILTHWGLNNLKASTMTANPNTQTANNASLLFLHDAWVEFTVIPGSLHVGSGLHYWNGHSRLTNQSTLNFMIIDNPGTLILDDGALRGPSDVALFPWNAITTTDQFARHMGLYAKGTIGGFSYRVSANNPRRNLGALNANTFTYDVPGNGNNWLFTGYFNYNFLDAESDKLPFFVGSYLGAKEVLSIGAGFMYHPDALAKGTVTTSGTTTIRNISARANVTTFAVDAFYDAPVGDGAINVLAAYYNFDYGNETKEGAAPGGALVPGSGSVIYGQLGYMLPLDILNGTRLMPYVYYISSDIATTPNTSSEFSAGLNWFINGHHAKITAAYARGKRGVKDAQTNEVFTLQAHIFL